MTDKPAAIQATYSDLKFVKTRGVVQIVLEADIADAPHVIDVLGTPNAAHEVQYTFAVVKGEAAQQASAGQEKPKQHYRDMKPSQRAGIMCNDRKFWQWAGLKNQRAIVDEIEAAGWLCRACKIESRTELDNAHLGQQNRPLLAFAEIETEFRQSAGYEPSPDPQARAGVSPSPEVARPPVKPESEGADSSPSKGIFETLKLAADHSRTHKQLDGAWRDNKGPRGKLSAQEHEKLLLHYSQRRKEIEREQG